MDVVTYVLSISLMFLVLNKAAAWSVRNHVLSGPRVRCTPMFCDLQGPNSRNFSCVGRALMSTIDTGMQEALYECQSQFQWDRWNCPERSFDIISKHGKHPATRESAFIIAMVNAAMTHTFAKNCSRGQHTCRCDNRPREVPEGAGWSWGGCSVDVEYSGDYSRKVIFDRFEANKDIYAAMNEHNNEVGTAAVHKTLKRTCRCHGLSGACNIKTCWMKLGDMSAIGRVLRKAYDRAHFVDSNRGAPKWPEAKKVLVYSVPSYDYCRPNHSLDIAGTQGRECSWRSGRGVSVAERNSCRNLCHNCGHGIRNVSLMTRSRCKCRFHWCCTVNCSTCYNTTTKYLCN